jgi:hypothetical protein
MVTRRRSRSWTCIVVQSTDWIHAWLSSVIIHKTTFIAQVNCQNSARGICLSSKNHFLDKINGSTFSVFFWQPMRFNKAASRHMKAQQLGPQYRIRWISSRSTLFSGRSHNWALFWQGISMTQHASSKEKNSSLFISSKNSANAYITSVTTRITSSTVQAKEHLALPT